MSLSHPIAINGLYVSRTNGEQRSSNRARGRGSGRGRGRGGLKAAPIIVQSEGTFTKGLSDGVLKANRLNNYGNT